jgi:hypothetical protein
MVDLSLLFSYASNEIPGCSLLWKKECPFPSCRAANRSNGLSALLTRRPRPMDKRTEQRGDNSYRFYNCLFNKSRCFVVTLGRMFLLQLCRRKTLENWNLNGSAKLF